MRSDPAIWLANHFYTRIVGRFLPSSWFGVSIPAVETLAKPNGRLSIDIVAHCWQYSHLLVYQLSSLVNYPPTRCNVTYKLYYSEEDAATVALIETFSKMDVPGVTWCWLPVAKSHLFRRAIGRHQAAKTSQANWIWFSDCDLIFHRNCLDSLAAAVQGLQTALAFPQQEFITDLLPEDHPLITESLISPPPIDIDTSRFKPNRIVKAKGAFQIVHGDVARAAGYCGSLSLYQQPDKRWRKTYEDTVFRNLIGSEGVAVSVDALHRIRHIAKGRYSTESFLSKVRSKIRRLSD